MKHKLLYLFPFLLALTSGCFGSKNSTPIPSPDGTFSGQFRLIQKHSKTGISDTATANIQLVLDLTTGYKVTGDTSTLHAGSYGDYGVNSIYNTITFVDKTYPKTGIPTKTHLNGQYQYYYDGSTFQMVAFGALDTLILQYNLKKTN